jgi:hypothetical protein
VDACKERLQTFIDQVAKKSAPAGSEATVSTWKSAMENEPLLLRDHARELPDGRASHQERSTCISFPDRAMRHAAGQTSSAAKQ